MLAVPWAALTILKLRSQLSDSTLVFYCTAGFHLNFAKMAATWGEHQPAYYLATHNDKKEVVVAIRGTWAVEDVVTDINALPVVSPKPTCAASFQAYATRTLLCLQCCQ